MNQLKAKKSKPKSITTIEIEIALAKHFNVRVNIIVPNISWGMGFHEMDLAVISKSGYLTEIEIKISKADFLKDFEKGHGHIDRQNRISHFYYAMPKELYEKVRHLIPENAGVIVCQRYSKIDGVYCEIKKEAVKIKNARKLTIEEQFKIAKLGCMRIFILKSKYLKLKNGK